MPIRAPRCFGSAAMVVIVSDAAWNSRPYTAALFWSAMSATSAGSVNTTWGRRPRPQGGNYPTGSRSASRSASQVRAAAPWHLGQCRLRQLL